MLTAQMLGIGRKRFHDLIIHGIYSATIPFHKKSAFIFKSIVEICYKQFSTIDFEKKVGNQCFFNNSVLLKPIETT